MVVVFEDDLFLYEDFDEEEKAIVVAAFGEKDNEALVIILSRAYIVFFCSQTLLFLYTHTRQSVIYVCMRVVCDEFFHTTKPWKFHLEKKTKREEKNFWSFFVQIINVGGWHF